MPGAVSRFVNVPFAPARMPFFYGWVMVAASVVSVWASVPGQTMGVGVFRDSLMAAWNLSSTQLSVAYMAGTILSSLLLPWAGVLMDRAGMRAMTVYACVGMGLSLVVLAQAPGLVPAAGGAAWALGTATLCFLLLRFFGQGCLSMVSRAAVGKWFDRRRGWASAVGGVFNTLGFNASPALLDRLIAAAGWRGACHWLAAVLGIGVAALAWAFVRDNPEQCGLRQDGGAGGARPAHRGAEQPTTREFTRVEALRTRAFWVYTLALSSHGLLFTAFTFHMAAIAGESGLERAEAYALFLPMAAFSFLANIVGSWQSDRMRLKWPLCAMMLSQLLCTVGLLQLDSLWGRALCVSGFGVTGGLFTMLVTLFVPRFFGRAHLGAISGFNTSVMVFTSALGPVCFSLVEQATGRFAPGFVAWLLVPGLLCALGLRTENPQPRD
jgi:MFS family permease